MLALDVAVEQRQRLLRAAEILLAVHLVVRDHHRHPGLAADQEGLLEALEDVVALVAHVGDVAAAERLQPLGQLDHLLGRRLGGRGIEQAGRQADRAGRHRGLQPAAHGLDLAGVGRAQQRLHGADPERRMPDEERRVDRGRLLVDGAEELVEGGELPPLLLAQQVERRRRPAVQHQRRQRDAAVADHHAGHAWLTFMSMVGFDSSARSSWVCTSMKPGRRSCRWRRSSCRPTCRRGRRPRRSGRRRSRRRRVAASLRFHR